MGCHAVQGHASHVYQLAQGTAVLHMLHVLIMLAALAISNRLILLIFHNINIMNQFLINLVGHDDHYLAKKQVIKEIFAYTKFPKSATSKQYLWSKDLTELAAMHRELLTMQVEIA
jgi:hypothetical protein